MSAKGPHTPPYVHLLISLWPFNVDLYWLVTELGNMFFYVSSKALTCKLPSPYKQQLHHMVVPVSLPVHTFPKITFLVCEAYCVTYVKMCGELWCSHIGGPEGEVLCVYLSWVCPGGHFVVDLCVYRCLYSN
jgi:hypothetical protein